MTDHPYVPRRDIDTGEAPYSIRQHGHLMGCVKCGGSPLAHGGPLGWPWWKIFGTLATLLTIAAIVIRIKILA